MSWRRLLFALVKTIFVTFLLLALLLPQPRISAQTKPVAYRIAIQEDRPVLRLYRNGQLIRTYPVALGKPATRSPIGTWQVIDKQMDWGKGFGTRWLGLNVPWGIYGIHGTNRPELIGKFVSNGCIRMYNKDVEELYRLIPIGTPVVITGNPLKYLRTLEHGDIGADVQLVQRRLRQLGFYKGDVDGVFGLRTQNALTYFQLARRLPMHGQVTRQDYRALGLLS